MIRDTLPSLDVPSLDALNLIRLGNTIYSETCVREPPLRLTLNSG